MKAYRTLLLLTLSTSVCSAQDPRAGAAVPGVEGSKPNIVSMFIDDMGYGDIGPFGNTANQTPNLDRMAEEGIKLTQFYVANTACTPSRAALLTGTYAHRIGMDGPVVFPGDKRGLNPNEITIAEMLRKNGYATGCFGKWHLGDQPEFMPLAQGFDTYFGIPYSNDMWPGNKRGNPVTNRGPYEPLPVMLQNKAVAHISDDYDQALLAEVITDEAIKFIRKNKLKARPEDFLVTKKPLSESETLLKNQLKDKINLLATKYAIPSELICSSKNLVKLIKGDNSLLIQSGWRSDLFKL